MSLLSCPEEAYHAQCHRYCVYPGPICNCEGDKGKPKTTEPTTCKPALSEGISLQGQLTEGNSVDSQLGQAEDQDGLSEMQEGHFRPGVDPQEKPPRKMSTECDGLGTADGVCSRIGQEQVSPGDTVQSHNSCESVLISLISAVICILPLALALCNFSKRGLCSCSAHYLSPPLLVSHSTDSYRRASIICPLTSLLELYTADHRSDLKLLSWLLKVAFSSRGSVSSFQLLNIFVSQNPSLVIAFSLAVISVNEMVPAEDIYFR
ncbi:hypothetical protein H8959_006573 [Pygathrix nigripes]